MTVKSLVEEPLIVNRVGSAAQRGERVKEILEKVGLTPHIMNRFPHEFSGGQRQRIGIARALSLNPRVVICDEPVSALDVSVQAQVLNLLEELQRDMGLTYLFIAHDLSVVEHISDRVMVMYLGKCVEITSSAALYQHPLHPYTEALLSAIPIAEARSSRKRIILEGNVPDPSKVPEGCSFHTRCRHAGDICREAAPKLREVEPDHSAACHFANELTLMGYEDRRKL
jgi:oligopeptide/dipeptide ABC transporter ATP-binding protein